jgi:hemoglobin
MIAVVLVVHWTAPAQGQETAPAAPATATDQTSLYARLGGVYSIAAVVDDFVDRLLANPTITSNVVVVASMQRINPPGLKFHLTAMVCEATGGPEKYSGRAMKETHAHLGITEAEWQAMAADFKTTLDKFGVPPAEQDELFAIVGTTKADIVKPEAASAAP